MWQQHASALRPLGAGERIDAAIKIVRRNFLTFVKAALPVALLAAVVFVLILLTVVSSMQSAFRNFGTPNQSTLNSGSLATILGGLLVLDLFLWLVVLLITAIAIRIVGNAYLGQPTGWRDAVAFGVRRLPSVLWIECLLVLAYVVIEAVNLLVSLLASSLHAGGLGAAIGAIVGLAEFVAVMWFYVGALLAVPIMMTENIRGTKAIRRSLNLVRGHWWSTFGTLLLAGLLSLVGGIIFFVIFSFLLSLLRGGGVVTAIGAGLTALLVDLLFASFYAAVLVVITIDLRVRKEGFDIQLLASVMGVTPTDAALSFMPAARGGYPGAGGYGGYPSAGPGGYGGYPATGAPGGYGGYPPPGGPPGYGGYPPPGSPGGYGAYPPPGGPGGYGGYPPPGSPGGYGGPQAQAGPAQPPPAWDQQTPPAWSPPAPKPWGDRPPPGPPAAQDVVPSLGESTRPLPPFHPRGAPPPDPTPPREGPVTPTGSGSTAAPRDTGTPSPASGPPDSGTTAPEPEPEPQPEPESDPPAPEPPSRPPDW